MIEHNKGEHLLQKPILSYLARALNHPYVVYANLSTPSSDSPLDLTRFSRLSFGGCGIVFRLLCDLGDYAKEEVVDAGALPGLCRLAHRDSYDAK